MGAGASALPAEVPQLTKDKCKELAGDKWSDAVEAKFDELAKDGAVTAEQYAAYIAEQQAPAVPAATGPRKPIVGGNWKCNPGEIAKLDELVANINACDVMLVEVVGS